MMLHVGHTAPTIFRRLIAQGRSHVSDRKRCRCHRSSWIDRQVARKWWPKFPIALLVERWVPRIRAPVRHPQDVYIRPPFIIAPPSLNAWLVRLAKANFTRRR